MILTLRQSEALQLISERAKKSDLPMDASLRFIGTSLWVEINEDGAPLGIRLVLENTGEWTARLDSEVFADAA